jgi:hypothetical protein
MIDHAAVDEEVENLLVVHDVRVFLRGEKRESG